MTPGVTMKVAIVGGGIGGLTTALCCAMHDHEVTIFEQAEAPSELGAGIQVSPNAARVLDALDLWEQFTQLATFPERIILKRWRDDAVLRATILGPGFRSRFEYDYANVHRADLAKLLMETLRSRHDIDVQFRSDVVGVDVGAIDSPPGIRFSDGSGVEADVVIGADGIHSAVRSALFGEQPARFSGAVAYRALIPRSALADSSLEVTNRLGPGAHVVTYVIGRDDHLLNLVCVMPEKSWHIESWTEIGSVETLIDFFGDWSTPLNSILRSVPEPVYRWALHDREPLARWGMERVTLIGDACHPMLPFMAQGACQAIEDAWVLARSIRSVERGARSTEVSQALRRYERARQGRTAKIQSLSLRNRDTFHLPDGEGQARRDDLLGQRSGGARDLDWLYGYDPTE